MTPSPNRSGDRGRSRLRLPGTRRREVRDHQIAIEAMTRFARNDVPAPAQREPLALLTNSLSAEADLTTAGARSTRRRLIDLVGAWPIESPPRDSDTDPGGAARGPLIVTAYPGVEVDPLIAALLDAGAVAVGPPDPFEIALTSWSFELDWHVPTYAEWLHDADLEDAYRRAAGWVASMPRPPGAIPLLMGSGHLERLAEIAAAMPSATVLIIGSGSSEAVDRAAATVVTRRTRYSNDVDPAAVRRYLDFRLSVMSQRADAASDHLRVLRVTEQTARSEPARVAATAMDGGRTF